MGNRDLQPSTIFVNVKGVHKTLHVLNDQGSVSNILQLVSRRRMRVGIEKDEDK